MNADEQKPQDPSQKQTDESLQRGQGGSVATGQASYGNSGETDTDTLSANRASSDQQTDLGETGREVQPDQNSDNSLFSGSDDDLGSAGTGRSGIPGSIDDVGSSAESAGGTTGRSDIDGSLGNVEQEADDQNFAEQGQGALTEDAMGSAGRAGTTDIETERSQGRENDIEGSSL